MIVRDLSQLTEKQFGQYQEAIPLSFPPIITNSQHIAAYWPKLEKYFPTYQLHLIDEHNNVAAFMNTVPFYWDQELTNLPDKGWDWMLQKGIEDYENNIQPNMLGGLQVIVPKENQRKGYSKKMIAAEKARKDQSHFKHLVIPIRPILKDQHPTLKMIDYIEMKKGNQPFDPWIKTHLNSGAEIIQVCSQSMKTYGDLKFWKEIKGAEIKESGNHIIPGALNLVQINVEDNYGEYLEENIWIAYE